MRSFLTGFVCLDQPPKEDGQYDHTKGHTNTDDSVPLRVVSFGSSRARLGARSIRIVYTGNCSDVEGHDHVGSNRIRSIVTRVIELGVWRTDQCLKEGE